MPGQANVSNAVVEQKQQAEARKPIRVDDAAVKRCTRFGTAVGADENAAPLERATRAQLAEAGQQRALDRPRQLAFHALERLLRQTRKFANRAAQGRNQLLERASFAFELGELTSA